jgi:hypothetical protein
MGAALMAGVSSGAEGLRVTGEIGPGAEVVILCLRDLDGFGSQGRNLRWLSHVKVKAEAERPNEAPKGASAREVWGDVRCRARFQGLGGADRARVWARGLVQPCGFWMGLGWCSRAH